MIDTIAIKVADGSLQPILHTAAKTYRRVILTPETDNQDKIVIELYQGIGKELFDRQLIDVISIEDVPPSAKDIIEISLELSVNENHVLDMRLSVEGTHITMGRTYDLKNLAQPLDISEYTSGSTAAEVEPAPDPETAGAIPIDEDFVLGIESQVSYDREEIRKEKLRRAKGKIKKGLSASTFVLYALIVLGVLLVLAFIVYMGIALPPMPPLES